MGKEKQSDEENISISSNEVKRLKQKAELVQDSSKRLMTERQMFAYLLLEEANLKGKEASKVMHINSSTVYSLKMKAKEKLIGMKLVREILEQKPWWAQPDNEYKKEEITND